VVEVGRHNVSRLITGGITDGRAEAGREAVVQGLDGEAGWAGGGGNAPPQRARGQGWEGPPPRPTAGEPGGAPAASGRARGGGGTCLAVRTPPAASVCSQLLVRGPRVVTADRFHFLGDGGLYSPTGDTSNVRSSLQSLQTPLTSARTFQLQPCRLWSAIYPFA